MTPSPLRRRLSVWACDHAAGAGYRQFAASRRGARVAAFAWGAWGHVASALWAFTGREG